jgi:hypothetical protein
MLFNYYEFFLFVAGFTLGTAVFISPHEFNRLSRQLIVLSLNAALITLQILAR